MRNRIKGVLIDLDGVLRIGKEASRNAAKALGMLREHENLDFRIVTNTTTETSSEIVSSLEEIGF